jgi:hypothetical protein
MTSTARHSHRTPPCHLLLHELQRLATRLLDLLNLLHCSDEAGAVGRLLTPSFARLIRRERGGLRHVESFFPEQRDRSSWIRLEEERGLLILKTIGPHGEAEDQTDIPAAHAHALLDVCAGEVDYTRTAVPIGEGHALIDEIIRPVPYTLSPWNSPLKGG